MSVATAQSDNTRSVWIVILAAVILIGGIALAVWGWQKFAQTPAEQARPVPIYLSIDKIAARAGYANRTYFCKLFRKHAGLTPRSFRTQSRK